MLKLTGLFTLTFIVVDIMNWNAADARETRIEGLDVQDCAEGADEDLKTPVSQSMPPTS